VLTGEIHAHNTFDAPEGVVPTPLEVEAQGKGLTVRLPAASVVAMEVRI
jgi:alpha-L-arabinofuranosidase